LYGFSYIVASDWLDSSGFDFRQGQEIYLLPKMTRSALVPTQLHSRWEHWARSPVTKRPGREANRSSQSNAKVKIEWSYTFTSTLCIHDIH